ncbi:unnamed protein product [Closterium sp. Naga37s-1]|nr:unnamed protein product [Closterium sp. Naga37s-1]
MAVLDNPATGDDDPDERPALTGLDFLLIADSDSDHGAHDPSQAGDLDLRQTCVVSELLSPFIARHGPGGNREVKVEGIDSDGRPARFKFVLHEDELEEFEGPGTHDGCVEVCTEFAEVIVHQLEHRLGDLNGMSGARLFTPDEYPLERGERNRRCLEWLQSLVTLFKADRTDEILPVWRSYKKRKPQSNAPLPPAGKQHNKKGREADEEMDVVDLEDEQDAVDSDDDDGFNE